MLTGLVLAFFVLLVLQIAGVVPSIGAAAGFFYAPAILAACLFWHQRTRRMISRAAAHDHLLCPDCTYDLRTLDAAGACPECGRAYEHDAVRAQWVDAQRRLKRN